MYFAFHFILQQRQFPFFPVSLRCMWAYPLDADGKSRAQSHNRGDRRTLVAQLGLPAVITGRDKEQHSRADLHTGLSSNITPLWAGWRR